MVWRADWTPASAGVTPITDVIPAKVEDTRSAAEWCGNAGIEAEPDWTPASAGGT